MNALLPEIT
jgi:hypothetical protein